MRSRVPILLFLLLVSFATGFALAPQESSPNSDAQRVIAAVMGPSPMGENLRVLSDEIGGRVSGTDANRRGVEWAVAAFQQAGADSVRTADFTMPASWSEGDTRLEVLAPVRFAPRAVSIAWSPGTPANGLEAAVVDVGSGSAEEFARAGAAAKGALVLVHSNVLRTWADLFEEYFRAPAIIERAIQAGPVGILWMSSRQQGLLYRHINSFDGRIDRMVQALVAREDAQRMARFIAAGQPVRARLTMPNKSGGPFTVQNVIAEIRGTDKAEEVVMIGAHLDSWELGSGALDNGCNSALVVEVARAIRAAGIKPRRTIRFALWNGEEQGLLGSWAYARAHRSELDRFVAYVNIDGGIGHITGWSLGGRGDSLAGVREALAPVESWGMNRHTLDASTGTDHVDFLLEGVPTLNANQVEGNYIVNYHASSDTLDKVDIFELKRHAAYAAVTVLGLANRDQRLGPRQSRAEVQALIEATGLDAQMKAFGLWEDWADGRRGREK
ncbi:MAG: M28 family peptidase [Candidatus Acidiferrales bacterium]